MKTIWKFPILLLVETSVEMPKGARILTVQAQLDQPQVWAVVDPEAPREMRRFRWIATGRPEEDYAFDGVYLGTVQLQGGGFVFHLFEEGMPQCY